jgi:hypothetical protein
VEHVVFFPAADGAPAFRRVSGLEEAVRFVEHLRNEQGVSEASVHVLTEVPLSFKAYYRVEVPSLEGMEPLVAPVAEVAPAHEAEPVAEPVAELVEEAPVAVEDVVPAQAEPAQAPDLVLTAPSAKSLGFFA